MSVPVIELKIPATSAQCVTAYVQVGHRVGAAPRRIERETAGKAERVENAASARQSPDPPSVLTLIQEEAGLPTAHDVRFKLDAVSGTFTP